MLTAVDVLSGRPCAITEEGLHLVLAVVSRDEFFADVRQRMLAGRSEDELDNDRAVQVVNGTAVIPIEGPLFAKTNMMTRLSGATSYAQIRRDVTHALDDNGTKRILFAVDSPGGDASGVNELADFLFSIREAKPTRAYVPGQCNSAALWLMSQVGRIDCAETAYAGAIGVITALVDARKADEEAGVRKIEIVSSRARNKRSFPVDDEVIARAQAHCDEMEAIFIDKVARGRGVGAGVVAKKFGQGDTLIAGAALEAGLIDGISSFDEVLADFAAADRTTVSLYQSPARAGGKDPNMKTPQQPTMRAAADDKKPGEDDKAKKASEDKPGEAKKAEDKKPEEKASDSVKCMHCDGDGFMPDGSKCETCGGSGEMKKAKADDGDADDKAASKKADMEDGDSGEAKKAMAAMAGLPPTATLPQIHAALQARTAPLTEVARLQQENVRLASTVGSLVGERVAEKAELYVAGAIQQGRTTKDKARHLIGEFTKAEKAALAAGQPPAEKLAESAGARAIEPMLYARGTFTLGKVFTDGRGKPLDKEEHITNFAQADATDVAAEFAACADKIAKDEKVSIRDAQQLVKLRFPAVYARYAAITQSRRARR